MNSFQKSQICFCLLIILLALIPKSTSKSTSKPSNRDDCEDWDWNCNNGYELDEDALETIWIILIVVGVLLLILPFVCCLICFLCGWKVCCMGKKKSGQVISTQPQQIHIVQNQVPNAQNVPNSAYPQQPQQYYPMPHNPQQTNYGNTNYGFTSEASTSQNAAYPYPPKYATNGMQQAATAPPSYN